MQPWQNESLSFEERARDLVSRMTLEEKISQMGYMSTALPVLRWRIITGGMSACTGSPAPVRPPYSRRPSLWPPPLMRS